MVYYDNKTLFKKVDKNYNKKLKKKLYTPSFKKRKKVQLKKK